MRFFVKTEMRPGKVDDLTRKIANREVIPVEGSILYVSRDGRVGYNLVEASDEAAVRRKYAPYDAYIELKEITPVESMGRFLEGWKAQHGFSGQMPGRTV